MGLFLKKNHFFKMLGLAFYTKLDWGSYIIPVTKTAPKKIGALICSMKFHSPRSCFVFLLVYQTAMHEILLSCLG